MVIWFGLAHTWEKEEEEKKKMKNNERCLMMIFLIFMVNHLTITEETGKKDVLWFIFFFLI